MVHNVAYIWLNNILLCKNVYFYFQGVNGSINGNSTSSVSGINTSVLSTTASSSVGQTKSISSGGGNRKCNQEQNKNQPLDARAEKIKDKVNYSFKNFQEIYNRSIYKHSKGQTL